MDSMYLAVSRYCTRVKDKTLLHLVEALNALFPLPTATVSNLPPRLAHRPSAFIRFLLLSILLGQVFWLVACLLFLFLELNLTPELIRLSLDTNPNPVHSPRPSLPPQLRGTVVSSRFSSVQLLHTHQLQCHLGATLVYSYIDRWNTDSTTCSLFFPTHFSP